MPIAVDSDRAICTRCGTEYGKRSGAFPACYAESYKGLGYIPICKECIDGIYNKYLSQCKDPRAAVRQMCRKLDLYWHDGIFDSISRQNPIKALIFLYITKINSPTYAGKSYDNTLMTEDRLWSFGKEKKDLPEDIVSKAEKEDTPIEAMVAPEIIEYWGAGYTPEMYAELEKKKEYWLSKMSNGEDLDVSTEAIIKQICGLELDISRDRAAGRSVDKNINALNTLLGSANLKPSQKKDDGDASLEKTPFGMWIQKWEEKRPIPEPDPELKDADGIVKYILTWFYGHLAKMCNIKNAHSKLYDDAIETLRAEHPEYDDEDDDEMMYDLLHSDEDNESLNNHDSTISSDFEEEGGDDES